MARPRLVTRTVKETHVTVLCLNTQTGEPYNEEITICGSFENDEKLLKHVAKKYNSEIHKAVHIVDKEVTNTLYGMPEDEFVKNASVMPDRVKEDDNKTE